jgi:hypothetical protein
MRPRILFTIGVIFAVLWATIAFAATWTLRWTDASSNETEFRIERRVVPSGTYSQIGTAAANATTYVDSTATDGWSYRYRIRAYNATGNSTYSNEVCAPPPCTPTAPTGVTKAP